VSAAKKKVGKYFPRVKPSFLQGNGGGGGGGGVFKGKKI
jgi:hypothetical protein